MAVALLNGFEHVSESKGLEFVGVYLHIYTVPTRDEQEESMHTGKGWLF